jgi:hypothetical protein
MSMTTDDPRPRPAAARRGRHPGGRGRFAFAGIAVLVLCAVLASAGTGAAPSTVAPTAVRLVPADPVTPPDVADLRPVSDWEQRFLATWESDHRIDEPASRSPDSWEHYDLAYAIDSNTAIFRATGTTRYLDRALAYVGNVVATARLSSTLPTSQYHDGYLGWVSFRVDLNPTGVEVPLYESYFWRYATTMLRAMRDTPAVYGDPSYRARYDSLVEFAEIQMFDKWYARGANDTIYRSRTHLAAHWAMIALNLALLTSDPTRRARYREVVDNIDLHLPNYDASLRGQLRQNPVEPSAYFWNSVWGSFQRPGQDVSHGNGVLAYLVEARDRGDHWTDADMAGFAALLTRVIWPAPGTYRDYVDGSGVGDGWFSDGFVKLGRYDAAVQQRLEQHPSGSGQFAANMALNAAILS